MRTSVILFIIGILLCTTGCAPKKGECYESAAGLNKVRVIGVGRFSYKIVHLKESAGSGTEIVGGGSFKLANQIDCPEDFQ